MKTLIKNYGKLIALITSAITCGLTLLEKLPWFSALPAIGVLAILLIHSVWIRNRSTIKYIYIVGIFVIAVGLGYYSWIKKPSDEKKALIVNNKNTIQKSPIALNNPIFNGPTQVGNGNKMSITNYNTPKQRHFENSDVVLLIPVPLDATVFLRCLKGNVESANLQQEFYERMSAMGYQTVSLGTFDNPIKSKEKFTVKKEKNEENTFTIQIIPQQ